MSITLPTFATVDPSSLSMPSSTDVGDAVVTVIETAGDAASVVVTSARKRPLVAASAAAVAALFLIAVLMRRRSWSPRLAAANELSPDLAA